MVRIVTWKCWPWPPAMCFASSTAEIMCPIPGHGQNMSSGVFFSIVLHHCEQDEDCLEEGIYICMNLDLIK